MFIKDEQYYLDLEKAKIARTLSDPEEDAAYARIVMKGDIGSNGRNYSNLDVSGWHFGKRSADSC